MSGTPTQHHPKSNRGRLASLNNQTYALGMFVKTKNSKNSKKNSPEIHQQKQSDSMEGFTVVKSKRSKSSKTGKSTTDGISTGNTYGILCQQARESSPKIAQPQVQSNTQPSASATFWGNLTK